MTCRVFNKEATVPSIISEEWQNWCRAAGWTEVKLGWQLRQLVNVHFRGFGFCRFLFRASRCGFVRFGWLLLRSLLPVDRPVLCLLLLGRLHLRLGFGEHGVAGWKKLLNRGKENIQFNFLLELVALFTLRNIKKKKEKKSAPKLYSLVQTSQNKAITYSFSNTSIRLDISKMDKLQI